MWLSHSSHPGLFDFKAHTLYHYAHSSADISKGTSAACPTKSSPAIKKGTEGSILLTGLPLVKV